MRSNELTAYNAMLNYKCSVVVSKLVVSAIRAVMVARQYSALSVLLAMTRHMLSFDLWLCIIYVNVMMCGVSSFTVVGGVELKVRLTLFCVALVTLTCLCFNIKLCVPVNVIGSAVDILRVVFCNTC
jgi:hypothetical protein